jgi:hypothetical protein
LLIHPNSTAISGVLAIWLGLGSALAQEPYRDPNTAEGWALPQIERSEMADFNERCNTPALDPNDEKDARWRDDCRTLSARFLQDLLRDRLGGRRSPPREFRSKVPASSGTSISKARSSFERSRSSTAGSKAGSIWSARARTV